jgi:long-chain acyl-CoA synthetase
MNIYPDDLEAALRRQPEVKDCVVVGIAQGGNAEPCAVAILRAGARIEDVVQRANQSLAQYQRMRMWIEWPEEDFPRTGTQKPRRNKVAEIVGEMVQKSSPLGQSARPGWGAGSSPNRSALSEMITRISGRPVAVWNEGASLDADLGMSSLDRVELLGAIEDRYQVDLSEARFSTLRTVGDLERMLRGETAPGAGYHYPYWTLRWPVTWLRLLVHYILMRPAVILLGWPRIIGREHLRGVMGPLLVISNHVGDIDPGFILTALPARFRHRLAIATGGEALEALRAPASERNFFLRIYDAVSWILGVSLLNLFPLPRQAGFRRSFAYAGQAVDRGYSLLVFPEGRLTTDGNMNSFHAGIGLLAENLGIPVLPMRIDGLYALRAAGRKLARPREICVRIGTPVTFPPGTDAAKIASGLQDAVERL